MYLLNDNDQESFGDDVVKISPLKELSDDLLSDCIDGQIKSPYDTSTNFLEEFHMKYEAMMDDADGDDDATQEIKDIAHNFYYQILMKFDKGFSLELDWEKLKDLNTDALRNLSEGIYEYFIIQFSKNIAKCITKIILDNTEQFCVAMEDLFIPGNVSSESYSKKLKDPKFAQILSNINQVVADIKHIPLSPEDFLKYFNQDRFEIAIMTYAVNNFIILGNFVSKYLYPIYNELQDDVYDDIVIEVHERLFQKFKKKEPITFEEFEEKEE